MIKPTNHRAVILAALVGMVCVAVRAQTAPAAAARTPAEIGIQKAREQIAKQPDYAPNYARLAIAYARRARETSDAGYNAKAEEILDRSFKLEPDNFEASKVRTLLLLDRQEFAQALEYANALHKRVPDDIEVYGYLVDANTALGNYDDAVDAAQWMLNLRPGNIAGLTRAGYLRELHGNFAGAVELMHKAYDATPFQEFEDRAWLLARIAHLQLLAGDLAQVEMYAHGALGLFPGYHYALGVMAEVRLAQNRNDEAVALLEKRYAAAPHAGNLFALAEALDRAGRKDAAAKAFAEFEQKALRESSLADNANHELVAYYVDYAHQPAKALQIATQELARRQDAFTLDAYAWALAACEDYVQASTEMQKAVAFVLKDPGMLRHSSEIARHLSQTVVSR
jgi:tetratricopeptide (TPR) repeat protein